MKTHNKMGSMETDMVIDLQNDADFQPQLVGAQNVQEMFKQLKLEITTELAALNKKIDDSKSAQVAEKRNCRGSDRISK